MGDNYIRLDGMAGRSTGSSGTLIGTLPTDFRPSDDVEVPVATRNGVIGAVLISKDGTINLLSGDPSKVSFDGITFLTGISLG
jgi:hypothetical protein